MLGTPYFGNLEGTYANQGQTEVTSGYPRRCDSLVDSRGCP
jgi:hypothetical protein